MIWRRDMLKADGLYFLIFHKERGQRRLICPLDNFSGQERIRPYVPLAQIKKIKRSSGEARVFICPFSSCLKEFDEISNLKTHVRSHTGERPFQCDLCHASFITTGHLKNHMQTHSAAKPFFCTYPNCNAAYTRPARLRIHQRTHPREPAEPIVKEEV